MSFNPSLASPKAPDPRRAAAEERRAELEVKGGARTAAVGREAGGRNDRLFAAGISIAIILTVVVGFAPTHYLKGYFGGAPLTPLVHMHGLVFTFWGGLLLLISQAVRLAVGHTDTWLALVGRPVQ
jgi:hypothetical protein